MEAGPIRIVELMANVSSRFVVPVYQRPYSWDEQNCEQLWQDIINTGRRGLNSHFTGSVVWIMEGTMSPTGVTPRLLIDGQQRVTTVALLMIALARMAKADPERELAFPFGKIIDAGYLVSKYEKGDDHYRLTLSQGDREIFQALVDNLLNDDMPVPEDPDHRLLANLKFFEDRVASFDDPNLVWAGLQRLEVVSISLAQGQDNPQLIFESMNSTGKDLKPADLIRNYVLMGQPDQEELYRTYWRPIEEALGASTYESVFDSFVRTWLTVCMAPEVPAKRDVYQSFKDYVTNAGYGTSKPITSLLKELQRFARYYAAITAGRESDDELRLRFDNIRRLDAGVVNSLLLSFYDDYEHNAFGRDGFIQMLDTLESYLFRRAACDIPTHGLNKWFPSLIARLNAVQDESGNYVEALTAYLLNEAGTPRRFPSDAEFKSALKTRDSYGFKRSLFMLSRLENRFHTKNEIDFSTGAYTIEHIMPQNALAHKEWRDMLADIDEEEFEVLVHNIGNLTLTAYNSELSDGTFAKKKNRIVGGYKNDYLVISGDLKDLDVWNATTIGNRADKLIGLAVDTWQLPEMEDAVRKSYIHEKKGRTGKAMSFKDIFNAGLVKENDVLVSASPTYQGKATVTAEGSIRLESGEEFTSPSLAFIALMTKQGGSGARNGWHCWRMGDESGELIDELRNRVGAQKVDINDRFQFRVAFWDDLYERCDENQAFVEAFGSQGSRAENRDWWATFGIGLGNCHLEVRAGKRDKYAEVGVYYPNGQGYEELYSRASEIEFMLGSTGDRMIWIDPDSKLKYRALWVHRDFDYDSQEWSVVQDWMMTLLLRLRTIMVEK